MKHEELTGGIIGAAMAVLNELKPGAVVAWERAEANRHLPVHVPVKLSCAGGPAARQRKIPAQALTSKVWVGRDGTEPRICVFISFALMVVVVRLLRAWVPG